jgi:hypothetical protein
MIPKLECAEYHWWWNALSPYPCPVCGRLMTWGAWKYLRDLCDNCHDQVINDYMDKCKEIPK